MINHLINLLIYILFRYILYQLNYHNFLDILNIIELYCGIISIIIFNYNVNNIKIIRKNGTKSYILIGERILYSIYSFLIGSCKIFIIFYNSINYLHILYLNENPINFGFIGKINEINIENLDKLFI